MAKAIDKERIVELLENGMSVASVAQAVGCSAPWVYQVGRETGHVFGQLGKHWDEIVEQLKSGYSVKSIAKRYGVAAESVRRIRDSIGIERALNNQWGDYSERLARAICVIEKHTPMFEYVGGFTDTDSPIDLRCKVCGTVKRVSMITVRKGKVECAVCRKLETEKRQQARRNEEANERKERQEAKARERLLKRIDKAEQTILRFCSCGALLANNLSDYCPVCQKRIANKRKEISRRVKIKNALIDSDITVQEVFRRDGGRCWLCGEQCDPEDFIERDGTVICGDLYPSIDHVIPLSKGGEHSWANVKLAHRRCNYLKSDSMPPGCA